ncbi:MAG TPA: leucyl aminopeptidase family protein [Acidimicrobiales bacterium]|nr:MAG: hypothetical protein B7Z69_10075 [Actinobacteria bacterium 21-73-9]HQU27062.1 leucyl aminopeptidase family protein [Acidimicrobiales bacterium]
MARTARVVALKDALVADLVAVPVTVATDGVRLDGSVPGRVGGVDLPRAFDAGWCELRGLSATPGTSAVLRAASGPAVALVSVGASLEEPDGYRLAGAAIARLAGEGTASALLAVTGLVDPARVAGALVEGAVLASYRFKRPETDGTLEVVALSTPLPSVPVHDAVVAGVARGVVVADAANWAKRLVDTPAGDLTPKELARTFDLRLSVLDGVSVEVWTESRIREEGLGGLLGVGLGSAQPARLVRATYTPASASRGHVVLVGKGVTFDSGGLSLKPAEAMMAMKTDMTGSAVVMAALAAAAQMGLRLSVTAIAPLTENLPGDQALKPGDVLRTRDGTSVEVLNTDAEGRLILADALGLAAEAEPDAIVDVATLTGAQRVALGDEIGALFASDDALAEELLAASAASGEALWRLPLASTYATALDSEVADLKNIGRPGVAATIVAALFLQRFTKGRAWAHLDIAGPARSDGAKGYVTKGGTAFSTRTLIEFLVRRASR